MDIYDADRGTWESGPELPRGVHDCNAVMHAGEIHLFDDDEERCIIYRNEDWEEQVEEHKYLYGAARQSLILG